MVRVCAVLAVLMLNGIDVCLIGLPSGRVIVCTCAIPRTRASALAILSITRKSAGFLRS
ncbi:Uncharacterised protein [Mycobacteroides abscessus subsp. abscessus]|nr:Uncharacterised protein [Mycobacteroides abscessus subsp. abscessus]SKS27420.1 Uncharacterised protein [Mycobacteroides abscessus subsp. abscessus]SKT91682.1 Uncharacterised protein [Mycobacteroides abscessus subsp. abscessus]